MRVFAEEEYEQIVEYVREHGPINQSDIIRHFTKEWYHDMMGANARVKIGYKLKRLEDEGILEKRQVPRGTAIPYNRWRIKDGNRGISKVSAEVSEN